MFSLFPGVDVSANSFIIEMRELGLWRLLVVEILLSLFDNKSPTTFFETDIDGTVGDLSADFLDPMLTSRTSVTFEAISCSRLSTESIIDFVSVFISMISSTWKKRYIGPYQFGLQGGFLRIFTS